jgi:PAS domain S-box-containing protein
VGEGESVNRQLLERISDLMERVSELERSIASYRISEEHLREQVQFESLVSDLSGSFVNLPAHLVDREISRWLGRIGEFLDVDRCTLFEPTNDVARPRAVFNWGRAGIAHFDKDEEVDARFPWTTERLQQHHPIIFGNADDFPDEAVEEREYVRRAGLRSGVTVPLFVGESYLGALSAATFLQEKTWTDEAVRRLQLVGEVLANALARRRNEADLSDSEQLYRTLFESAGDAIFALRGDEFIDCNSTTVTIFGCESKDDVISRTPWKLSPALQPDGQDSRTKAGLLIEAAQHGTPQRFYWQHRRLDGSLFDAEVSLSAFTAKGEKLLLAIVRDITDQTRAEKVLRDSEERHRAFIDKSLLGIVRLELDEPMPIDMSVDAQVEWALSKTYVAECNDAYSAMYGLASAEDLIGKRLSDIWVDGGASDRATARQFIESGYRFEHSEIHEELPEESDRWFLNTAHGVIKDGHLVRIWGTQLDVTDRKEAEAALVERDKFNRAMVDQSPLGVSVRSSKNQLLSVNETYKQIWGVTEEQLEACLHDEPEDLTLRDSAQYLGEWLPRVEKIYLEGGWLQIPELHLEKRWFGRERWVSLTYYAIKGETGAVDRVITLTNDITEQKRAEEALIESEERFTKAFRATPDAVSISSLVDSRIIDVNAGFERLSGLKRDAVIGQTVSELGLWVNPEERSQLVSVVKTKGWVRDFESRINVPGADERAFSFSAEAIEIDGEACMVLVGRDINDQREAEKAVQASEEKFARAFHASPDPIIITSSATGRVIDVNDTFERISGHDRSDIVGTSALDLNLWADPSQRDGIMKRIAEEGTVRDIEMVFQNASGERRTCLFSAARIFVADEPCHVSIVHDITDQLEMTRALKESEEKFSKAFRSSPVSIAITNVAEGRILDVNDTFQLTFGFRRDDIVGKTAREINLWKDLDERAAVRKTMDDEGRVRNRETVLRNSDGEPRDCLLSMERVSIGGELCHVSTIKDVTDEELAHKALRYSEGRYRNIVQGSPLGMIFYRLEDDGRLIFEGANPAFSQILGITTDNLIGKTIEEAFPPLADTEIPDQYRKVAATGQPWQTDQIDYQDERMQGAYYVSAFQTTPNHIAVTFLDITDSLRDREALRESEEKFRTLFRSSTAGIAISTLDGKFLDVNDSYLKMLGYDFEELQKLTYHELTPEKWHDVEAKILSTALETGRLQDFEKEYIRKDGTLVPVFVNAWVIRGQEGHPDKLGAIVTDITERKLSEAALRNEKEFTETALNSQQDTFFVFEPATGRAIRWNRAFEDVTGYTAEEISNIPAPDSYYSPADLERARTFTQAVLTAGIGSIELELICKDGRKIPTEYNVAVVKDEEGQPKYFISIGRDITKRKRAEALLKESESKFKAVFNNAFEFMGILTTDGVLTQANQASLDFGGVKESDVLGKPFWETAWWTHSPEQQDKLRDAVARAAAGEIVRFEAFHPGPDGTTHYADFSVKPVRDEFGKVSLLVPEGRDITERKQAEEALKENEELLRTVAENYPHSYISIIERDYTIGFTSGQEFSKQNLDPEQFVGQSLDQVFGDQADIVREQYARTFSGEECSFELFINDQYQLYRTVPLYSEDGSILRILAVVENITETKLAEKARRESEEKFRDLADNSPNMIFINVKGRVVYVNRKCMDVIGYTQDEFLSPDFDFRVLIHRDHISLVENTFARHMSGKDIDPYEYKLVAKDGHIMHAIISTKLITYEGERAILGVVSDVSDLKHTQQALEESEEKYRSLIDNIPEVVWTSDADGHTSFITPNVQQVYGYTPEEIYEAGDELWFGRIHKDDLARVRASFGRLIESGEPIDIEYRIQRRDGKWIWLYDRALRTYDKDGKAQVEGIFSEITERKLAEQAVRESELRYRAVVEDQADLVCRFQRDGTITFVNDAYCRYFEKQRHQLVGAKFLPLIPDEDRSQVEEHLAAMGPDNPTATKEHRVIVPSGEIRWHQWTHRAILDQDEVIVEFQGVGRDITDRKLAEQRLAEAQALLLAAIEQSPAGILVAEAPDVTIRVANSAALGIRGESAEALTDIPYELHPSKWQTFRPDGSIFPGEELPLSQAVLKGKTSRNVEAIIRRPDGSDRWVLANAAPVRNAKGEITGGIVVFPDVTDSRRADLMLQSLVKTTASITGRRFFRTLVKELAQSLGMRYALVGELSGADQESIRTLAVWSGKKIMRNFEYGLAGTPCQKIIEKNDCLFPSGVCGKFPNDTLLADLGVEGYLGTRLISSAGEPLGILVVMHDAPIAEQDANQARSLLSVFADRATTELERLRVEEKLERAATSLQAEHEALEEKNAALREILSHAEAERATFKHELCASVEALFAPVVESLKQTDGRLKKKELGVLEQSLNSLIGKDIDTFQANYARLSPRELVICDMIRNGLETKEIADELSVSPQTIEKHRASIRRKLQIQNKNINLAAFLKNR